MKKINLSVAELMLLEKEMTDFLSLKLKTSARFRLLEIKKILTGVLSVAYEMRDELVRKFGKEKDGQILVIPKDENGNSNPQYEAFFTEWAEIARQVKELEFEKIPMELIEAVESEIQFEYIFKLV